MVMGRSRALRGPWGTATTSFTRAQPGPTQQLQNIQLLPARSQRDPTQATTTRSQASAPFPDPTPIAVEFRRDYVMPRGIQVPTELQNSQQELFPQAKAGERGWATRQQKITTPSGPILLIWVVVSAEGATR